MTTMRSAFAATIFGFLAQIGFQPGQPSPEHSAQTITQIADGVFATIRSEVASGLQAPLKSREIHSRDLAGIVALLDSSKAKLQEGHFNDKLNRAGKQMEMVQSQAQAVLKDPGNKEVFAVSFDPENSLGQLRLQKATAAILDRKIDRFRAIIEELRKCTAILEGVTPPEQLTERIKLRLTQLSSEWKDEPPTALDASLHFGGAIPVVAANQITNRKAEPSYDQMNASSSQFTIERGEKEPRERQNKSSISNPVRKVIAMKQQKLSEKLILRYINSVKEPFDVSSAEQILLLQEKGLGSSLITAMLRHDNELHELAMVKSRGK